ncbi:unnamed protein product [Paramecium primaurelia]|uniref:Transmembrane protein n=1 Tax=Paramecium primaurelia TaxID=5886 RepID=A0A8S1MDZ9_PARPR|nr:unnamed protein product [Paramecium primaurelia]
MVNFFECLLAEIQEIELIYSRIIVMFRIMVCQILNIFIGFQLLDILKFYKFQSRIISITILYLYIQNYASLINYSYFKIFFNSGNLRISDLNYIQSDVSLIYFLDLQICNPQIINYWIMLELTLFFLPYINKDQHNKINFKRNRGYLFNEYTQKNYFWSRYERKQSLQSFQYILKLIYF